MKKLSTILSIFVLLGSFSFVEPAAADSQAIANVIVAVQNLQAAEQAADNASGNELFYADIDLRIAKEASNDAYGELTDEDISQIFALAQFMATSQELTRSGIK